VVVSAVIAGRGRGGGGGVEGRGGRGWCGGEDEGLGRKDEGTRLK